MAGWIMVAVMYLAGAALVYIASQEGDPDYCGDCHDPEVWVSEGEQDHESLLDGIEVAR